MSALSSPSSDAADLFFESLVRGYVEDNPRFVRRDWLAKELDQKLAEPGKRFVLLTAEPGAGKSSFLAQLAHDHPEWLRYFIRRDQRSVLADVSDKSLLLRVGYQLAARRPELFTPEALRLSVVQKLGEVGEQGEVVGAEVKRLTASPFYQKVLEIEQQVRTNRGKVVGLRVEELVVESRLLPAEDLLYLALIHPVQALARADPTQRIVILIDALDEIRYHPTTENILAWLTNCPALPENIRFVLTSRPPDEALNLFRTKQADRLAELAIAEGDVHVQQDVERFVTGLIAEPALVQALQETDGGTAAFAKKATDKAHGNLGYLDALARGIDQALARKDSQTLQAVLRLKELPTDLEGLYAFFLRQIKTSVDHERIELRDTATNESFYVPVWPAVYHRILGVLAVAMEPLDLDLIMRLGGIRAERVWVSNVLDRLLQFLDALDGRYRFYHATVAEFLTADKTRDSAETADFYQGAQQRHHQITDYYWRYHDNWQQCDEYGFRNLAGHLNQGQQFERLEQLISQEWMHARVARDGYRYFGFVADLMLAWGHARDEALRQIDADDDEFGAVVTCFRYALIRASVSSLSRGYPPVLVRRMLETRLWRGERALDVAAQVPDAEDRVEMYLALLAVGEDALTDAERIEAQRAGLAAARAIGDKRYRAQVLAALAPQLCGEAKAAVLEEALAAVRAIEREPGRAYRVAGLPPQLRDAVRAESLQVARPRGGRFYRSARVLAALAPQLTGAQLGEALAVARAIDCDRYRVEALAALAPQLTGETKTAALDEALAAARAIEDKCDNAEALAAVAPQLVGQEQTTALDEALAAAQGIENAEDRAHLLADLVPHLTAAQLGEALAAGWAIEDCRARAGALAVLAPRLAGEAKTAALDEALAAARAIVDCEARAVALAAVVPQLAGEANAAALEEALAAARAIQDRGARAGALAALALQLVGDAKTATLDEALAAARECEDAWIRAWALTAVAPQLTGAKLSETLAKTRVIENYRYRAEALAALATHLSGEAKTATLDEALAAARASEDGEERVRALMAVATQLRGETRTAALEGALAAARAIKQEEQRAYVLAALVPHLTAAQLGEALAVARAIDFGPYRVEALAAVVPQLTGGARTAALDEALAVALAVENEWYRAKSLAELAPHLTGWQLEEALAAARAIGDKRYRPQVLAALGPQLRGEAKTAVLEEALAAVRATESLSAYDRTAVLSALAPQLGGEAKTAALGEALAAARVCEDAWVRAWALATVVPQLTGDAKAAALDEALAAARAIGDVGRRFSQLLALLADADHTTAIRDIRGCLVSTLSDAQLAQQTIATVLSLVKPEVLRRMDMGPETCAALARHIIEIPRQWRWL